MEESRKLSKPKTRSFLQMAKRFGKKGNYGKGREISQDVYHYFVRVLETFKERENEDDESLFVENVFCTTRGKEIQYSSNQLVSRVIEKLLPKASFEVRSAFMTAFVEDFRVVFTDTFASHVLEKLLYLSSFEDEIVKKYNEEQLHFCTSWVLRVTKFGINNLETFAQDVYASQLLKSSLQCVSGIIIPLNYSVSKQSQEQGRKMEDIFAKSNFIELKKESDEILESLFAKLNESEYLSRYLCTDVSCSLIQVVLLILEKRNLQNCKHLCKNILDKFEEIENQEADDSKNEIPQLFNYISAARTLEVLLSISGNSLPKIYSKIVKRFFDPHLIKLLFHPIANFSVQKLINSCLSKECFESWYENIFDENLDKIRSEGNTGLLLAIAQTCRRLSTKQAHFIVALMKSLHCFEPSSHQNKFVPLLSKLSTKEVFESNECSIHLQGTLILQELLQFNKPIKIVSSLLAMEPFALKTLLSDPRGCHITDIFMMSPTIGEKSRDGLIKVLGGELSGMAMNKHGSRSIDAFWKNGSPKSREFLASNLASKLSILSSNKFSVHICNTLNLSTFKRNKEEWKTGMSREEKKRKLFNEFLIQNPKQIPKENTLLLTSDEPISKKRKKVIVPSYLDDL